MAAVLVLDAHLKQALVVNRSLGSRGLSVTAGSTRGWTASLLSNHVDRYLTYPSPKTDTDAFLQAVEVELHREDYGMVLPIEESTVETVVEHRDRFEDKTTVPFPPLETLQVGLDKRQTIEAARQHGISHPKTVFSDEGTVDDAMDRLEYPIVVKPVHGMGRVGYSVCDSEQELIQTARQTMQEHGPILYQEFVPNGGERGFYGLYDFGGELVGHTVQRRIRSKPPDGGPSTYRETVEDPGLESVADSFLRALDWQGVAMVEFRIDQRTGEPLLMEINPRLWGSLALSVFADVDFPYLLYQLSTEGRCEPQSGYLEGVQARCLFTDFVQVLQREDRLRATREFLSMPSEPCCYDILSREDPLPVFGQMVYWAGILLGRRFGHSGSL